MATVAWLSSLWQSPINKFLAAILLKCYRSLTSGVWRETVAWSSSPWQSPINKFLAAILLNAVIHLLVGCERRLWLGRPHYGILQHPIEQYPAHATKHSDNCLNKIYAASENTPESALWYKKITFPKRPYYHKNPKHSKLSAVWLQSPIKKKCSNLTCHMSDTQF